MCYFTIFNIHGAKNRRLDGVIERRKPFRYSKHRSSLNAPGLHNLDRFPGISFKWCVLFLINLVPTKGYNSVHNNKKDILKRIVE